MILEKRIAAFVRLGEILRDALTENRSEYYEEVQELINGQQYKNGWFTPESVRLSIESIANELTEDLILKWTAKYPLPTSNNKEKNIALIMAGNMPLASFNDFVSVLISGNRAIIKRDDKDADLIKYMADLLIKIEGEFDNYICFPDGLLPKFDAIIVAPQNKGTHYYEQYFKKYPSIIRKSRYSVAVLDGSENDYELSALGNDVFNYFGLSSKNVSKIFIPNDYDLKHLLDVWQPYHDIIYHVKYGNNYDFNKSVYLVNKVDFLDNGFLLLKEDKDLISPISVLFTERYTSNDEVKKSISLKNNYIHHIVGHGFIPFGESHRPILWDYDDNIDTLDFLLKKIYNN